MGDYITFINQYGSKYKIDIDYNEYEKVKSYIITTVNEIISFRGIKFDKTDKLLLVILCMLLSKYKSKEILTTDLSEEIEDIIKDVYNKLESKKPKNEQIAYPLKNESVDYVYNLLKEIRILFDPKIDIGLLAKNIKEALISDNFQDKHIITGLADYRIYNYLANEFFDLRYVKEYYNIKKVLEPIVIDIFLERQRETKYSSHLPNIEYKYYSNIENQKQILFTLCSAFFMNSVRPKDVTNEEEMSVILNAIRRDEMRYSSVEHSTIEEKQVFEKNLRVEEISNTSYAKKLSIVIGELYSLECVSDLWLSSFNDKKGEFNKVQKYKVNDGYAVDYNQILNIINVTETDEVKEEIVETTEPVQEENEVVEIFDFNETGVNNE